MELFLVILLNSLKSKLVFKGIVKDEKFKTIVELVCNDLYLLKSLKLYADKLIGIDPILKGK